MHTITRELRYAARQLRKSPGFTLTALLTLALGVGVTAAVYGVIHTVLLQPLPYTHSEELVGVAFTYPHEKPNAEQAGASADFIREHAQVFAATATIDDGSQAVNLSVNGGNPQQVTALRVSEGYFRTLAASAALGRVFTGDEDRPHGPRVVVLSDPLWTRVFHRDRGVTGRTIHINEESFTVVGVMPASFAVSAESAPGVLATPELWEPLQLSPQDPVYDGDNFQMIARLKPGVTLARAQAELNALREPFYQQYPSYRKWVADDQSLHDFKVWTLQDVLVGNVQRSLWTVMGAVVAVLLVACLNLAGLVIARSLRRGREMAVRTALGASRGQLLRLLLCEGLLIATGGGMLALAVSQVAAGLLLHAAPIAIPALRGAPSIALSGFVVMAIALASTVLFSLLPAWMILRVQSAGNGASRLGNATAGETVSQARLSRALVVAQVAMAMLLVSTASVLVGTFVKLQAQPSGVEPKELTVFQVTLKGDRYAKTKPTAQFVDKVLNELRGTPGVDGVTAIQGLPLDRGLNISGYPPGHPEMRRTVQFRAVAPEYFKVMGIQQLAGRGLTASDRAETDPVVVIGETMAKRWWPGRSPIGEYLHVGVEKNWRIVGVTADVRNRSLLDTDGMLVYTPLSQLPDSFTELMNEYIPATFAVRTAAHVSLAEAAQRAVAMADPEVPIAKLTTMQAVIDETIREPRFFSLLAAGFSGFALVLTVIGLFGLLSYQVTQRTREIGVRMALGADREAILSGFLKRGLTLAAMGVGLGWGATWMMRPVIAHLLADAGVDAGNGAARVVMNASLAASLAAAAMVAASIAASWLPARRAAAVEPMQALRAE